MEQYNLLPADTYIVYNKTILTNTDRQILSMLYQPIIGPLPIILYFSLWSDLEKNELLSNEFTHHHLEANMHMSLSEISQIRAKLEAIGLLKTLVKEDTITSYIYELYSPLSAHEFFNHPILNIVLYSNVGKKEYNTLVDYFKTPRLNTNGYTDISASFNSVFGSVPMTSYEAINDSIRKYNKLKLNINTNFDFDFLIAAMPSSVNKERLFTKENKELILELSFLYEIDAMKMQNIIKGCLNERGTISKDEFRKACRNYYQFDNKGVLPTVVYNSQPEYLKSPIGDTSKRAKMIYTFETISPYDLLKSKNNGAEPTNRDIKLAEDLVVEYKLKPGVVNVLIDYILKTNNNKLTRALAETIAGQWKRLNIETVEEAMSVAEKEHKKYKKNIQVKTPKKLVGEKIPEWFDKEIKKEEVSQEQKIEMEKMLKEYQ